MNTKALLAAMALCGLATAVLADTDQEGLTIGNFYDYEVVPYSVPLIRGTYTCPRQDRNNFNDVPEVSVKNETTGRTIKGTGLSRRYKVWPRLAYGTNLLTVTVKTKARTESNQIHLVYSKPDTPYKCYVYWMVDCNGDNLYYSPYGDKDPQNTDKQLWHKKFETQMLLNQSFMADSMYRLGYPRKTFVMDTDENDNLIITVVTSKYTRAEICSWVRDNGTYNEGKLYDEFCRCLGDERKGSETRRVFGIPNVAMIGVTDDKNATTSIRGGTALGGYSLAQFGSTGLYAWPAGLDDIVQAFTNTTLITTCMNDSCGRNVQWAHAATTMGAYMHEGGHCFGLPHIEGDKYNSVMARSYDIMNRLFTSWEMPTSRIKEVTFFEEREEPVWSRIECHILQSRPNISCPPSQVVNSVTNWEMQLSWPFISQNVTSLLPTMELQPDGDTLLVKAPHGLAAVTFWGLKYRVLDTPNCHLYPLDGSVKEATLSLKQMRAAMVNENKFEVKIWDCKGNHIWPIIDKEGKPTSWD